MSERGFFSKLFGGREDEDETRVYSAEEMGMRRFSSSRRRETEEERHQQQGFTVERAAEIIDDLPPEVPRESAVRIVRGTLLAAGIRVEDLERNTRKREAKLNSEMNLARERQEELRRRTEEAVRSLEEEIRRAREALDTGTAEEEENISRALASLEEVRRVRNFFGFSAYVEEDTDAMSAEAQGVGSYDQDKTEIIRRPGPLADEEGGPEGSSSYDPRYGPPDER